MKKTFLIPILAAAALSACSSQLSMEDRAMLNSANESAKEAKQYSLEALEEARAARAEARAASDKADKIFRTSQNK